LLVTGATGFIGRFLLAQLLTDTTKTIYCLVRARSVDDAFVRLRACLVRWNLWLSDYQNRIVVVPGDIRLPRLGIEQLTYQALCKSVGSIFHCATSMNHLETYAMAKPANVDATRELIKFSAEGQIKLLNYVSTLGVFRSASADPARVVAEDTPIDRERHLASSGYLASKWVGEKICMLANERGIPCNIFRLGLVWADSQHGRFDELQHAHRLLKTALLSGYGIIDYRYSMPPTPVDYVARAVVRLSTNYPDGGGIFHISSTLDKVGGVFEYCNTFIDTPLKLLPHYEWIREIRQLHVDGNSLPIVPLIEFAFSMKQDAFNSYLQSSDYAGTRFTCELTYQQLARAGIAPPVFDHTSLKLTVERILLNDPVNRRAAQSADASIIPNLSRAHSQAY
jgi:thioester reductase-like protein